MKIEKSSSNESPRPGLHWRRLMVAVLPKIRWIDSDNCSKLASECHWLKNLQASRTCGRQIMEKNLVMWKVNSKGYTNGINPFESAFGDRVTVVSTSKLILQEVSIAVVNIFREKYFATLDRLNLWPRREIKNCNCFPRKKIIIEWKFHSRKPETSPDFSFCFIHLQCWLPMFAVILSGWKLFPLVSGGRRGWSRLGAVAKTLDGRKKAMRDENNFIRLWSPQSIYIWCGCFKLSFI